MSVTELPAAHTETSTPSGARRLPAGWDRVAFYLLPGVLAAYLAFSSGGFFPRTVATILLVCLQLMVLRITLAERPMEGFSRPLAVAGGCLGLFALLTGASALWSHAPGRAAIEGDRALLYALALVIFGSMARRPGAVCWFVRGLALASALVCVTSLTTRLLPRVWPTEPNVANSRLSYPLSYWNALGLFAAVGLILCLSLSADVRERVSARAIAAGAMPPLAAALLFTFSRGAIVAGILGFVLFLATSRARSVLPALLASVPAAAVAVVVSYHADQLASDNPTTLAAVNQGHRVAIVVVVCALVSGVVRWRLAGLDRRLAAMRPPSGESIRRMRAAAVTFAAVVVVGFVVVGGPAAVARQYDLFLNAAPVNSSQDFRARLTDPSSNGRTEHWRVAFKQFERSRVHGEGAATYRLAWEHDRRIPLAVTDGHGLYFEVLGELGAVGLVLLLVPILTIGDALLTRLREPDRVLWAGVLCAAVAWAVHAGVDWDWEMPVVTLWVFAAGGLALAAPAGAKPPTPPPSRGVRVTVALLLLLAAVTPVLVARSETSLRTSSAALRQGQCPKAIAAARTTISTLAMRPEPYMILGLCDISQGFPLQAAEAMREAIRRDPHDWKYHYSLAVARAAAGADPRADASAALRLNPLEPLAQEAVTAYKKASPRSWQRAAVTLLPGFVTSEIISLP